MTTPTTFRTDIVTGLLAMLNGIVTAHPTLLIRAYRARPEGFPDLPCAYIDGRPEAVQQDTQTRTRLMAPQIVIVRRITNNDEAMTAFDTLVDYVVDAITANPQFAAGTMHRGTFTVTDEDAPFGDYDLAAVRITLTNISIMEGRT
jgi:hypothetical protein